MKNKYLIEHEAFLKRRDAISKMNKALIKKWKAEEKPWWNFWDRGLSFEQKRDIIISNWRGQDI